MQALSLRAQDLALLGAKPTELPLLRRPESGRGEIWRNRDGDGASRGFPGGGDIQAGF